MGKGCEGSGRQRLNLGEGALEIQQGSADKLAPIL